MMEVERMLERVLANQERMAAEVEGLKAEVARLSEGAVSRLDGIESSLAGMETSMRDANGYADSASKSLSDIHTWARVMSGHFETAVEHMASNSKGLLLIKRVCETYLVGIDQDLGKMLDWAGSVIGQYLGSMGFEIREDGTVIKKRR